MNTNDRAEIKILKAVSIFFFMITIQMTFQLPLIAQTGDFSLKDLLSEYQNLESKLEELQAEISKIDSIIIPLENENSDSWFKKRRLSRLYSEKASLTEEFDNNKKHLEALRNRINMSVEEILKNRTEYLKKLLTAMSTETDSSKLKNLYFDFMIKNSERDILVELLRKINTGRTFIGDSPKFHVNIDSIITLNPWLVDELRRTFESKIEEIDSLYVLAKKERDLQKKLEEIHEEIAILSESDRIYSKSSSSYQISAYDYNNASNQGIELFTQKTNISDLPASETEYNRFLEVYMIEASNLDSYLSHLDSLRTIYTRKLKEISATEKRMKK